MQMTFERFAFNFHRTEIFNIRWEFGVVHRKWKRKQQQTWANNITFNLNVSAFSIVLIIQYYNVCVENISVIFGYWFLAI